jgi:hypothetical protein
MIQKAKILVSLRRVGSSGVCTEELTNEWHIRRVGARIGDLRSDGYPIRSSRCPNHGDALYTLVISQAELDYRMDYEPEPPSGPDDFDAQYADMKARAQDEIPEPELPIADVEPDWDFYYESERDRDLEQRRT